jgi:hypothetical protein
MKRPRPTYSNVVATLALFFALGGGAYAATQLPARSVGTKQLRRQAVTPAKLSPKTLAILAGREGPAGQEAGAGNRDSRACQGRPGTRTPLSSTQAAKSPAWYPALR